MAYLNVRERRIEAKIAYVGPERAGKTSNLHRLLKTAQDPRITRTYALPVGGGDLLAISWQPPERARFRDCDVLVKVVAHRGAPSGDGFTDVLADADGVVVVADARPDAQGANRESFAAVRLAARRPDARTIPIVIQVNKVDLPEALPAAEVASAMGAAALPQVAASAMRGDGVVDTLAAAIDGVLAAMQREGDPAVSDRRIDGAGSPSDGAAPASDTGHPLLDALRQVLRETVRDEVHELEARLVARFEASLERIERSRGPGPTTTTTTTT